MFWIQIILFLIWLYLLWVLKRGELSFFRFILGSVGLFIFMVIWVQPVATVPLARIVAASTGVLGELTGIFEAYFQYGMIFIPLETGSVSMYIDYECSGIIEIMAFIAMLWFFPLYNFAEKLVVSIAGVLWIFASNIIRLFSICIMVHFFGNDIFFFAHTIFGRIIFYGLSIMLYFYVFTRSQIVRQKVGGFKYVDHT